MSNKRRTQFHQSFMEMLWKCEMQAMFRHKLGIRTPPRSFMHVGTGVHKSVQIDLQHKIDHGELIKRSDAIDLAAAHFDDSQNRMPIELDAGEKAENKSVEQILSENRDKTVALAGLHYDQVAPTIAKPLRAEWAFSVNMDKYLLTRGKQLHSDAENEEDYDASRVLHAEARGMISASRMGIDLAGTVDVVEDLGTDAESFEDDSSSAGTEPGPFGRADLSIDDSKTSSKSPNKDIAQTSEQLDIYSLASQVFFKKLPKAVRLDYLVQTKKRHDLKYVPVNGTRNQDDVNVVLYRFVRAVHRWFTACKTGDFAPARQTDWWCSSKFCGYANICPAFKQPKSVAVPELVQISGADE